jgi:hypothetical protein
MTPMTSAAGASMVMLDLVCSAIAVAASFGTAALGAAQDRAARPAAVRGRW